MQDVDEMLERGLQYIRKFKKDISEDIKGIKNQDELGLMIGAYGYAHAWIATLMACALSMPDVTAKEVDSIASEMSKAMRAEIDRLKLHRNKN